MSHKMDKPIVKVGDATLIECPHCNYKISHACKAQDVPFPSEIVFDKLCPRCNQQVHFVADWRLVVKASTARTF